MPADAPVMRMTDLFMGHSCPLANPRQKPELHLVLDLRVTGKCKDGLVAKRYQRVPELIMGFDTETTGLSVSSERAISYGFCAYRFGVPVWSEQFFVIPDRPISNGARRVHGLSIEDIEAKRGSEKVYTVERGLIRAVQILHHFHEQGAHVVGSNVVRFDLEMLRRSCMSVLAIEPTREFRPRRGQEYLCRHYGVKPGGHDALSDARAAVEVFLEQVVYNNAGQASFNLISDPAEYVESFGT